MLHQEQLPGAKGQTRPATPLKSLPLKNAILISNPVAGIRSARRAHRIDEAVAALREAGITAQLCFTSNPGDGKQLASEAVKQGRDLVIACGGDGTINEVINGLAPSKVPLAVLPGGTANIVAKELGLPGGIIKAARHLPSWRPCRVSLGRASWEESGLSLQRYFLAVAGVGFDAHVISHLNIDMKLRTGLVAYIWEAVRQVFRYDFPRFRFKTDGLAALSTFAVVQRSRRYAGWLKLAPPHSIREPGLSCCLFEGFGSGRYLRYAIGILTQTHRRLGDVRSVEGSCIHCTSEKHQEAVYFEVDGELTGRIPVTFEVVPDALTLLAPDSFFNSAT
jgi:YegS/Rv2252/BmrU family lipid kinase